MLIGFVGRDILSNLMGATVLYATQPFTKGDWIQSIKEASDGRREIDGWVEKIGWYYTVINTWDKRPLHLPNSKLATMEVINASRMTNRRILWQPKVRLNDMAVMPQIVSEMREALLANPELDPAQHRFVFLRGVSELSLDLWISCHTRSVFLEDFLRINQASGRCAAPPPPLAGAAHRACAPCAAALALRVCRSRASSSPSRRSCASTARASPTATSARRASCARMPSRPLRRGCGSGGCSTWARRARQRAGEAVRPNTARRTGAAWAAPG